MTTEATTLAPADLPVESRSRLAATLGRLVRQLMWVEACILLAIAHVILGGYRLGVGNQTIQIPFLKHIINPSLYPHDPTIETIKVYPTFFFNLLAPFLRRLDIAQVYLILHLVTAFAVLAAAYGLARAIFRDRLAGLLTVFLLFAGHHHALAGDDLYSLGFTHTWAVFPVAIGALIFFYRGWYVAAAVLTGLLFNLHALTAGYLLAMIGVWMLLHLPELGWKKPVLCGLLIMATALPTIILMLHHQSFDAEWVRLTYLRSADHSFPSVWWRTDAPDIPRFVVLAGLAAVSFSFAMPREQRNKSLCLALGAAILFFVGWFFVERPAMARFDILRKVQALILRASSSALRVW